MADDYIKLSRKMLEWEWYKNEHTKNVFIHCLLKACWKDIKYQGKVIKRGSFTTTYSKMANELDLTEREIRTAITHLKTTGELTVKTTNRNSVITVKNYDLYQVSDRQNVRQKSDKSQSNVSLTTDLIEEEYKEDKEKKEYNISSLLHSVMDAWNRLEDYGIKPIAKLTKGTKRCDGIIARMEQYGYEDVLKAIDNIKHSDFLQGKTSKWFITFDWFVKPNNFPKVLEGNYDNSSHNEKGFCGFKQSTTDKQIEDIEKRLRAEVNKGG